MMAATEEATRLETERNYFQNKLMALETKVGPWPKDSVADAELQALKLQLENTKAERTKVTSERDAARQALGEMQHEVEAARKLHADHLRDDAEDVRTQKERNRLTRRISKALDIISSLGAGAESPAMRETYDWLSGKRDA